MEKETFAPETSGGLKIPRRYTRAGESPFDSFKYELRTSVIRNPGGDSVFETHNVEVPTGWSQTATDILAQKYFRKAGVPQPDGGTGSETSVKQVVHRLAHCWRVWGERYGYFAGPEDAQAFYDEIVFMLLDQKAAPNSPQWFNTGLFESYGITGPGQGHWYVEPETETPKESESAYERPQTSACFILSVNDDLVNEGGIMDLWVREARIFKYGSGVGTNYSNIRAENEPLSGGGNSSGLMSFLKIGDRAAGAIKSGGTTRRAAKMVVLDADHPEIMAFIRWKQEEEKKVAALIAAGYSSDYEGEAYRTVSGQNANNSVRLTKEFFDALDKGGEWRLTARASGKTVKTLPAAELWNAINEAAWACADPGLQYDTTINDWHTCPAEGRIRASNPCSEYLFLDDTACNLASLNLRRFLNEETLAFDVEAFSHACRIWTVVLEISVLMAQYPSKEIARRSYEYRTLGLGYANLGSLLMVCGVPYDSKKATAIAGAITAILTGTAYATSAEIAANLGAFKGFEANKEAMLRVIANHRYAAYNATDAYEGLSVPATGIDPSYCPQYLLQAAGAAWDAALRLGKKHGYRNAQVSVLAPTGTIGLLLDCDTTGVEPDFALVKFKKLSGGGYFKIINQAIPAALRNLGYDATEIDAVVKYVIGHATLEGAPFINPQSLRAKGFTNADLEKVEAALGSAFEINHAFTIYTLGEDTFKRLGITDYSSPDFNLLKVLGFNEKQIESAAEYVCGTMTVEGAPYLQPEHYPIFDCANRCGTKGTRFIHAHGHIRMMAAAQSFISGAISKTINMPNESTPEEIAECYRLGWKTGLKAVAIYRDGSKLSQPLSSKGKKKDSETTKETQKVELVDTVLAARPLNKHELLQAVVQYLAENDEQGEFKAKLRGMAGHRSLPAKRKGFTQKAKVGGQTIFLRTGEYPDGTLGEIFIDMHKEGATLRSMLNCFAIAVSIGLQYGVPLEEFADKFTFTRFEPAGSVDHPNIKKASSIVDYIFRLLSLEYLDRDDLVQAPRTDVQKQEARATSEVAAKNGAPKAEAQAPAHTHTPHVHPERNGVERNGTEHHPPTNGVASNGAAKTHVHARHAFDSAQQFMAGLMGDAPACTVCGHITVRNGSCYKCMNCGNSMGCS